MRTAVAFLLSVALPVMAADPPAKPAAKPVPTIADRAAALPKPTHANVSYGPHERHVLDAWLVKSDKPAPLLFYIHGGGWLGGDKTYIPPGTLKLMLDSGISVVSINYRYTTIAPLPAPLEDAARALQFVRSRATAWNIDKVRIAAAGASAGAASTLWLAYHDDLADPSSSDPVARESTRLWAAFGIAGQSTLDIQQAVEWTGTAVLDHPMFGRAVGYETTHEAYKHYEQVAPTLRRYSAWHHVTADDPPVQVSYVDYPRPGKDRGQAIHHQTFGEQLKAKADRVGCKVTLIIAPKVSPPLPEHDRFLVEQLHASRSDAQAKRDGGR